MAPVKRSNDLDRTWVRRQSY